MSNRVIDFLGMRRGIGITIESFVPGIVTHWENQNQPAPRNQPYISLSFESGFVYTALAQEKKIDTIRRAAITIPDPLPPPGNVLWLTIDDWFPVSYHQIQLGDTPTTVRDSLLTQIQNLRPVKYALYFSAIPIGTNLISLSSMQLGGMLQVLGFGGLVVDLILETALYVSMPLMFTLGFQCYGTSSTTTTDFFPVGDNHPSSIWSTLSLKMRRRSFARKLYENATISLYGYPEGGQEIPAILDAGIEPRTLGSVLCATQALDFETVPVELQNLFINTDVSGFPQEFSINKDSIPQLPF